MSLFPETIAASLEGRTVDVAILAEFDFASEAVRLWNGSGTLQAANGTSWEGLSGLGAISGIEQAVNGQAPEATFTLTGIDADILTTARDEFADEVRGRPVRLYLQFFGVEDEDDPGNQRPLDNPYPIWWGRMLSATFALDAEGGDRSIAVAAESVFSLRSRPRHAMYTDRDQQARFPGDKGFEFVASLINEEVTWPDY